MSNQPNQTTLAHDLDHLVATRKTGTLFLKGDDGHAYAVAVQAGAIVAVWSGATAGNAAVEKLCGVKQASCRFSPAVVTPKSSRPDTSHVLRLLGTVGNETATNASDSSVTGSEELEYHERALSTVRVNLLNFLGPFATHILEDALRSWSEASITAGNLGRFLSVLAAEIDDDDRAREFLQRTISDLATNATVGPR